jgi:hypothetical protein
MRVLAVGACLVLALTAARPPVAVTAVLWLASGVLQAFWIPAVATFNVSVESELRGRAIAIAGAGLSLMQGIALAGGGALAGAIGPTAAVAWFAVAGLFGLAILNAWWPRQALGRLADEAFGTLSDADAELASAALEPNAVDVGRLGASQGTSRRE